MNKKLKKSLGINNMFYYFKSTIYFISTINLISNIYIIYKIYLENYKIDNMIDNKKVNKFNDLVKDKDKYEMNDKEYLIHKINLLENKFVYLKKDFYLIKNKYK